MPDGELPQKLLMLSAIGICIELVLFKFLPDIGTATIQHSTSSLADFEAYRSQYMVPGSVHHSRFLGNYLLYGLALLLERVHHFDDIRLHPLRLAAGILTPLYMVLGALPVLRHPAAFAWREFLVPYGLVVIIGLYTFYPGDMSSLAFLSIGLYLLLRERLAWALVAMLLTGLFRESAFHVVAWVAVWSLAAHSSSLPKRLAWVAVYAVAFVTEYVLVRHYFPGPVSSAPGGFILTPAAALLGPGLLSLTTLCSLSLAALFPAYYLVVSRNTPGPDWRRRFFVVNSWLFPAWIVFYRLLNGNISEFRLLLPALLPCVYGLSYAAATRGRSGALPAVSRPQRADHQQGSEALGQQQGKGGPRSGESCNQKRQ